VIRLQGFPHWDRRHWVHSAHHESIPRAGSSFEVIHFGGEVKGVDKARLGKERGGSFGCVQVNKQE